jgi:hypothetical protein
MTKDTAKDAGYDEIRAEYSARYVDVTGRPTCAKLYEVINDISELERDRNELHNIRATLLVNFMEGSQHNHFGFSIKEKESTHAMLVDVLKHYCENRKQPPPPNLRR